MTPDQLHILQHSLGLDEFGRGTMYRSHFVTGEDSIDHAICMQLMALGYMSRRAKVELCGGSDVFNVTEAGKEAALANSPAPPKLTAGQQRYRSYLAADSSLTFIEWLRRKTRQRQREATH